MTTSQLLSGKVSLVTGAAGGIGAAIAAIFASAGASVGLVDIDAERVGRTENEILGNGGESISLIGDIANEQDRKRVVQAVSKSLGPIDILVNNAADHGERLGFLNLETQEWERIIATNLTATAFLSKAVAPSMIERGGGCIINLAAIQANLPVPTYAAYVASKGGIVSLTRALAVELSPRGIRVNAIAPGAISTGSTTKALEQSGSSLAKAPTLLGRMGTAQDIAEVALFLASPASSFMTGTIVVVDGGRTLSREADPMASFGERS